MKSNTSNKRSPDEPINLKFKYSWRPEQQRVLSNILQYLDDKRIHLVAAPGAGKTVIGIEVFNQLKLKTLVVSPTKLIRNQWLQRLCDFLIIDEKPEWSGIDLDEISQFTSTTYQGLFSLDKTISEKGNADEQYNCISEWFVEHEIKLLILDEAHHLKDAWQRVLMKFIDTSKDLIVVSLTATPPYDASVLEWSRYQQLCGPVDEQISIPELVRSNSLCPHQDYIWMVKTDEKNITSLKRHQQNLTTFIDSLGSHAELLYLLSLHNWLNDDIELQVKDVLYHLDECFALLGLLKVQARQIPDRILQILDINIDNIQPITVFGWEMLLQSFIDGGHYPQIKPLDIFRQTFVSLLRSKHFLKHKRISLDSSKRKLEAFNKTQERIKACLDIATIEYDNRKDWMRLLILSDFIRDEKLQLSLDGLEAPTGAYPIFHYFIHQLENNVQQKTVLLTGRLVIIPKKLINGLANLLPNNKELIIKKYPEHQDFVLIKNNNDELTAAFTQLHKIGDILIIIGTRSLLGEGWDAPHVNSLIMATQTGAYVTTNQLRGRAIRIDLDDELKTASIWHIIALAENSAYNAYIFNDLHKRFKTFAGIHANELRIESGIERLALEEQIDTQESIINQSNQIMTKRLQDDVFNLQARWQNALEKVENHHLQTGLQIDLQNNSGKNNLTRYVAKIDNKFKKQIKRINLYSIAILVMAPLMLIQLDLFPTVSITAMLVAALLLVRSRLISQANIRLEPKYYSQKFAEIILASLRSLKQLQTKSPGQEDQVTVTKIEDGYYRFSLSGYTHKDNDLFLTALSQLLEPIKRPRYIIALNAKPSSDNIFPVPHMFAVKKSYAEIFLSQWLKYLPEFKHSQLLSTSSDLGRELLLRAKAQLYSQNDTDKIRLIDRWE
ncbi:MAG: DEAD/DEAH box helicase family protein [Alcanivoracaceae bacterium]|nr:DEAD/DEAH box helicase family protein [Alcanivoracaceae bacterium]